MRWGYGYFRPQGQAFPHPGTRNVYSEQNPCISRLWGNFIHSKWNRANCTQNRSYVAKVALIYRRSVAVLSKRLPCYSAILNKALRKVMSSFQGLRITPGQSTMRYSIKCRKIGNSVSIVLREGIRLASKKQTFPVCVEQRRSRSGSLEEQTNHCGNLPELWSFLDRDAPRTTS